MQPATVDVPVHIVEAIESSQLRATLKGNVDAIRQIAWSPDGKTLASNSGIEGEIKLWDVAGQKERAELRCDLGMSYGLAFTTDGKTLAIAHYKNKRDDKTGVTGGISLWDVATGKRTGLLQHTP
ncbi:MAG TPA: hypothetical protein VGZ25_02610, partial [Gemmataceae bacterium]|nr:hypothetical protein [Gemmataceae bacterium]